MSQTEVDGRFWLRIDGNSFAGSGRIELLEQIQASGSISAAARAMGMSYKAAWDAVDAMNNLAERPLVLRQAGGAHGGGTVLTAHGLRVIEQFRHAETIYQRFLEELTRSTGELGDVWSLMRALSMRTSARNHWLGSVRELRTGAVNDEAVIDLGHGLAIRAAITRESSQALGLERPGRRVHVLVKAPFVLLAEPVENARYSAGNQFPGTVESVSDGAVSVEITIAIGHGRTLTALASRELAAEPWLAPGVAVLALINPSHVILATSDWAAAIPQESITP